MTWGRFGDGTATHPIVLRGGSVRGADSRTRWELLGFAVALASLSGQHSTDYIVEQGTVDLFGGPEAPRLMEQMQEAGYITKTRVNGRLAWKIVDDPELLHLRLKEEIEWDRRRKADNGNTDLTLQVLQRDGSACRICGRSVSWVDRRGTRGGTYDHRNSGAPATTPDDLVVACRGCNSARGQADATGNLDQWDKEHPLVPVPAEPIYCDHARSRLTKHGIDLADNAPNLPRPGTQPDPATTRPDTQPGTADQERPAKDHGTVKPGGPSSRVQKSTSPGRVGSGSGRSGKGRDGPGRAGTGDRKPPQRRRKRGKRGRPPGSDRP